MVNAWAESNEMTAIPVLVKLSGSIIAIDAMGPQKQIAQTIIEKGADYLLALKENHKTFHGEVVWLSEHQEEIKPQGTSFDDCTAVDGGHNLKVRNSRTPCIGFLTWHSEKMKALYAKDRDKSSLKEVVFG